jgi:hypothetical protein
MNYSYYCDNCNQEISGEKARYIKKYIKSGVSKFGYCSSNCHWNHKHQMTHKEVTCKTCNKNFEKSIKDIGDNSFCSHPCSAKYTNKNRAKKSLNYARYRSLCSFSFDLKSYPNEFNFELLIKHGMYHSTKNINGVSRDHIVSIKYGFTHNVDPAIISHPANCQIILQSHNIKKYSKCDMTLEQLLEKIKIWDRKYR